MAYAKSKLREKRPYRKHAQNKPGFCNGLSCGVRGREQGQVGAQSGWPIRQIKTLIVRGKKDFAKSERDNLCGWLTSLVELSVARMIRHEHPHGYPCGYPSNGHGVRISVWMSAPSDYLHGHPYGYPCGCSYRIIRATDSSTRDAVG